MPELPSVTVYVERLAAIAGGHVLERIRQVSPFVLRSHDPPLAAAEGRRVRECLRIGKRIAIQLAADAPAATDERETDPNGDSDLYLVIHLMIAGRLRWRKPGAAVSPPRGLVGFDFAHGTLVFTEASKVKRASLHVVRGRAALAAFDRGGLEVAGATASEFRTAMRRENHTLKRALTDPRILSGIGNAYSDEILHRAKLSPFVQTHKVSDDDLDRLHAAAVAVLAEWTDRLRAEVGGFPDVVTAFHDAMAVHGKYRQPCPDCGEPVQRIRYAANEANYCARCQTGGRLLADRALSRLVKQNWPKTLDELERLAPARAGPTSPSPSGSPSGVGPGSRGR